MLECFIAYRVTDPIEELKATLEAWEIDGVEPVAIEVKPSKYEIERRVLAEQLSKSDYILADLGNGPLEQTFGDEAVKHLAKRPHVGIMGAWRVGQTAREWPNGVVICRKGIVDKWPAPQTNTYIKEHVEAYRLKGYKAFLCSAIHYRPLRASLPC